MKASLLGGVATALVMGCALNVRTPLAVEGLGNARIVSTGAVGMGLPSASRAGPTASVVKVDDQALSTDLGAPGSVTTRAGKAVLYIHCVLDAQALVGTPQPFAALNDGFGNVIGPTGGLTTARIKLTADLRPDRTYEVRCEPIGNYRARAWLTELP